MEGDEIDGAESFEKMYKYFVNDPKVKDTCEVWYGLSEGVDVVDVKGAMDLKDVKRVLGLNDPKSGYDGSEEWI